jgi:predicted AlkP superfamily phosphohydrolase/phosphomutase
MTKLLLIILDGVPYRNWRRLFGNLEGWVEQGEARVRRMRAVLPSTSASCYASIHTGCAAATASHLGQRGHPAAGVSGCVQRTDEGGEDRVR